MSKKGLDVSAWNTGLDYKAIKKAGYDFLMIRLGLGTRVDEEADTHIKGARAAGLKIGAYWFLYAADQLGALENARACLKSLKKYEGYFEYPIALDFEEDSIHYCAKYGGSTGKNNLTLMCKSFLNAIEKEGYYVSIYADLSNLDRLYGSITERYDTWLAQWGVRKPSISCGMWQYTDGGSDFKLDHNIAYYDYPEVIRGAGLNHLKAAPAAPAKPKTKTVTYTVKAGDTLSGICAKYGLDWRKVAKENKMENPDLIYPGQKIKLKGVKA